MTWVTRSSQVTRGGGGGRAEAIRSSSFADAPARVAATRSVPAVRTRDSHCDARDHRSKPATSRRRAASPARSPSLRISARAERRSGPAGTPSESTLALASARSRISCSPLLGTLADSTVDSSEARALRTASASASTSSRTSPPADSHTRREPDGRERVPSCPSNWKEVRIPRGPLSITATNREPESSGCATSSSNSGQASRSSALPTRCA